MTDAQFDKAAAFANDHIGTRLVLDTPQMRVWHIHLAPGETLPPHRHDRPYFWTVLTDGKGRARYDDGRMADVTYTRGDSKYLAQSPADKFAHDLTNTGDTELIFVTTEFNPPFENGATT